MTTKETTALRISGMWALIALYAIAAIRLGLNGELFIGVALGVGAMAGVEVGIARKAAR